MSWLSALLRRMFPKERRRHALGLLAVLTLAFAVRACNIERSLPYCRHVDESTWAKIALHMLRSGDPNPHRFRKPSLPVYVMTAGFSLGYIDARVRGLAKHMVDLGTQVEPYYKVPSAALPPKLLFTLASVLALGLAGWTGAALVGRPALLWLVPLVASISSSYLRLSWWYMVVDVIGTVFIWATIAYLVHVRRENLSLTSGPGATRRLVTLGVLAGLTVGSKYNLFPILVPCVLWFFLYERERWFSRCALLGLISVATFFVTTPFALITPGEFVRELLLEMHHYATGHNGIVETPGLPMLWIHFNLFVTNFGLFPVLLSFAGLVCCFRRDWRLSLLVFAYPAIIVGYMSMQRVYFERNVMAVHLHVALALAVALLELPEWLAGVAGKRWPKLSPSRAKAVALAALVLVVLVGAPWSRVARAYSGDIDPRIRAMTWLSRKLAAKPVVLVDPELGMDVRPLAKRARVEEVSPLDQLPRLRELAKEKSPYFVVTRVEREADYEQGLGALRVKAKFANPDPASRAERALVVLAR